MTESSSYIEAFLRRHGLQKIKRINGGFIACCPFHDDHNPSFSINDKGLWICYACSCKGNFKQLNDKLGGGEMDWREICRVMGMELKPKDEMVHRKKRWANMPEGFSVYAFDTEVYSAISKRLAWDTIKKFGLGQAPGKKFADRCIIPITYKGKEVGYHGRDTSGISDRKYLNPEGFEIKEYLFNYDGCTKGEEIVVVEGAFSCMSMVEKGYPNTVATFGTKFTSAQVRHIIDLNPRRIVICFDRDPSKKDKNGKEIGRAGQKAAMKLGAILSQLFCVYIVAFPEGRDPNDLSAEQIEKCYNARVKYEVLAEKRNGSRGPDNREDEGIG